MKISHVSVLVSCAFVYLIACNRLISANLFITGWDTIENDDRRLIVFELLLVPDAEEYYIINAFGSECAGEFLAPDSADLLLRCDGKELNVIFNKSEPGYAHIITSRMYCALSVTFNIDPVFSTWTNFGDNDIALTASIVLPTYYFKGSSINDSVRLDVATKDFTIICNNRVRSLNLKGRIPPKGSLQMRPSITK